MLLALRDRLRKKNSQLSTPPQGAVQATSEQETTFTNQSLLGKWVNSCMEFFGITDPYWGWIPTTLPLLLWENLRGKADAIYVTGPPWSPLILGALTGKLLGIPVYLDFRDPWTLNTYWKGHPFSRYLEKKVLAVGKTIITNTKAMEMGFLASFPLLQGRTQTLYNGYEPGIRAEMEGYRAELGQVERKEFIVSHIGMLYPNRMPPSLAKILAQVAAEWKGHRPIVYRFFGQVMDPAPLLEAFAKAGVPQALQLMGEVNTLTAKREEVKADLLLLLQSGTQDQIPAKAFEYVFAGTNILCVADKGSETANLFHRHSLGAIFHGAEKGAEYSAYMQRIATEEMKPGKIPDCFLEEFEGENLSARMLGIIAPQFAKNS